MSDKDIAYLLFKSGLSQTEIARILRKTESTVCKWKRVNGWEKRKAGEEACIRTINEDATEILLFQIEQLKKIKAQLASETAVDGKPRLINKGDLDGIRDLFNITRQKEAEWTVYVRIVRELTAFIKERDISLAQTVVEIFDDFLNSKKKDRYE